MLILLLAGWMLCVGGSDKPKIILRFHVQVPTAKMADEKNILPIRLNDPPSVIFIHKQPDLTEADVVSVDRFENGRVLITFNQAGKEKLEMLTRINMGAVLVVILNDEVVYSPVIDMVLMSGRFLIPEGVSSESVQSLRAVVGGNRAF